MNNKKKALNQTQKRFCMEYLKDGNGTAAAIRAGYAKSGAKATASRMLAKPYVRAYLDMLVEKMQKKSIATASEVMEYLTAVMRGETTATVLSQQNGEPVQVQKTPDEKERLKAAELIGKRLGLFREQITLDIEPVQIVMDLKE